MPSLVPLLKPLFRISQDYVQLSARRPVRLKDQTQGDYGAHDHEFAELCIIWGGTGLHITSDGARPLQRGSMIVMMPGQVHAFDQTRNMVTTNIYYLSEWLVENTRFFADSGAIIPLFLAECLYRQPTWQQRVPQFELNTRELRGVRRDLLELMAELEQPSPSLFFLRATFFRLLYRFAKAFERTPDHAAIQTPPTDVERLLSSVEIALSQRREFSVDDAAHDAGISRRHASRRFRQHVGMSLARYYQRRRIHLACNLLLDSAHSVTDVAHELNFSDGAHFCRAFAAERGMSPREFRKVFVNEGDGQNPSPSKQSREIV